ncbi:hypothetical protein F4703DRAFT_1794185 [Phycomyces blakesleeanus]
MSFKILFEAVYAFSAAQSPFFSYKNRYNSLFPVIPPLPPGFLLVVLGFRHAQCFLVHVFSVFYAQRPFHCSHGEVLHVKFMYQCPVSSPVLLFSTSTFQAFRSCLLVFKGMLMERCTENQLSIFTPFAVNS